MLTTPYDVLHDTDDLALMFRSDVVLDGATLNIRPSDDVLELRYATRPACPLKPCGPVLMSRIRPMTSILCVRVFKTGPTSNDPVVIPVTHLNGPS